MTTTAPDVELVDPRELTPHPSNPNTGDVEGVAESISKSGFYGVVLRQKATGYILAGHTRTKAAILAGLDQVPVQTLDISDHAARVILAGDNKYAELARRDPTKLVELLGLIAVEDTDLIGSGYSADDLADMHALMEMQDDTGDDDEVPPIPRRTSPGINADGQRNDANRRVMVLDLPVDRFAWLVEQLETVCDDRGLPNNAAAVLWLVSERTGSPIPREADGLNDTPDQ